MLLHVTGECSITRPDSRFWTKFYDKMCDVKRFVNKNQKYLEIRPKNTHMYLFESILACFSSRSSLFVGLDDTRDAGDLVEEVELAVEERVGRPVEALDDDSSAKQNKMQ